MTAWPTTDLSPYLYVDCPYCRAPARSACVSHSGGLAREVHAARVRAASRHDAGTSLDADRIAVEIAAVRDALVDVVDGLSALHTLLDGVPGAL